MKTIISFDIGIKNLAYCVINYQNDKFSIEHWELINLNTKDEKLTEPQLIDRIFTEFNTRPHLLNIDIVILENQPVYNMKINNIKMKTVSTIIRSYYIFHKIPNLININPSQSLKLYDGPPIVINIKNKYSRKKKLAIKQTEYFISDSKKAQCFFNKYKKKDDLADAFLNGLTYLKKKKKKR